MFGVADRRADVQDAGATPLDVGQVHGVVDERVEGHPGPVSEAVTTRSGQDGGFRGGHGR